MYWYKLNYPKLIVLLGAAAFLISYSSCKPDISNASAPKYFDIKGYFDSEAVRLTKLNRPVLKTVRYKKNKETKSVYIKDWNSELDQFKSADINKPAWKDSYSVDSSGALAIYKAKDPQLKTLEIIVNKAGTKVKWILIFNHTKNLLYQTKEKLTYFPDSLYTIDKKQTVRVLGTNFYSIKGVFNR